METLVLCNTPLETALKGAGFMVDGIEKKGKKTVITVERVGSGSSNSAGKAPCGNLHIQFKEGCRVV